LGGIFSFAGEDFGKAEYLPKLKCEIAHPDAVVDDGGPTLEIGAQ